MEKIEALIIKQLEERIGQLVSNYEINLATIKAQMSEIVVRKDMEIYNLRQELDSIKEDSKPSKATKKS